VLCSFNVEGVSRGAAGNGSAMPAEQTAPVLVALQQAGAHGTAKAATPELNLGCAVNIVYLISSDWEMLPRVSRRRTSYAICFPVPGQGKGKAEPHKDTMLAAFAQAPGCGGGHALECGGAGPRHRRRRRRVRVCRGRGQRALRRERGPPGRHQGANIGSLHDPISFMVFQSGAVWEVVV